MVGTLEQMQVQNETGPGVWRSKRHVRRIPLYVLLRIRSFETIAKIEVRIGEYVDKQKTLIKVYGIGPDDSSNVFFAPPAKLCVFTQKTEIFLTVTYNSTNHNRQSTEGYSM